MFKDFWTSIFKDGKDIGCGYFFLFFPVPGTESKALDIQGQISSLCPSELDFQLDCIQSWAIVGSSKAWLPNSGSSLEI